jgi:hypothetical protein
MTYKEIIWCEDGGPTPPCGMALETTYYIGIYDEQGTILCEFFADKYSAIEAFNRIALPVES